MWRKPNETKTTGRIPDASSPVPAKQDAIQALQSSPSPSPIISPSSTPSQTTAPVPTPVPVLTKPTANIATVPVGSSTSVIGAGLKIRGEISGSSDLHIEGETKGKIRLLGSRVSVGKNGNVQADIEAREIVIEGSLEGNLKASESVRLGPSSNVQGSVITPRVGIEDGARLRGKIEMVRANDSRPGSNLGAAAEPADNVGALRAVSATAESAPNRV